ncbi:hypothetical protein QFW77_11290 [Luteimonas sp. RD2P54]|uniref:Uncharacterized protein n=1 Tax=Luteimonas endophytica TaxID=3042023 RepID=A0ABT6J9Q9_9GAMM|nr:hypothetical protein [Luteimonas endophytica]MDH5823570.1 hypothetical protein [Luteimonas endophytica]
MASIIAFIRGIAARLPGRRAASRAQAGGCAERHDPSALIESLAMPRQWMTGGELADAYRSGCGGSA